MFMYPDDLHIFVSDNANPKINYYYLGIGFSPKGSDPTSYDIIDIDVTDQFASLSDYLVTKWCNDKTAEISNTTLDNYPALLIDCPKSPLPGKSLVIQKGKYIYQVFVNFGNAHTKYYSEAQTNSLFNQILSTFKFINLQPTPTAKIDTSNWKTYKNNVYFEFKYPQNWFIFHDLNNNLFISSTNPKLGGNFAGFKIEYDDPKKVFINTEFISKSPVTINGFPGYKLTPNSAAEDLLSTEYYISKENLLYKFSLSEDLGFPERNEKEINNEILSTFEFIPQFENSLSLKESCQRIGGIWLDSFMECERASNFVGFEQICNKLGGEFNECKSACRHAPNPLEITCTANCILVCKFPKTIIPAPSVSSCKTGGCSSELCLDSSSPDVASICIYKEEWACLKYSRCEIQSDGKCGWTNTPEYSFCLQNY